jgi:hypothetical protein
MWSPSAALVADLSGWTEKCPTPSMPPAPRLLLCCIQCLEHGKEQDDALLYLLPVLVILLTFHCHGIEDELGL